MYDARNKDVECQVDSEIYACWPERNGSGSRIEWCWENADITTRPISVVDRGKRGLLLLRTIQARHSEFLPTVSTRKPFCD